MGAFLQARGARCGAAALAAAACTYPLPADEAVESGAPSGAGLRTYDVRGGGVQDGNQAVLRGVVVTVAPLPGPDRFFVQDPEGGPDSGLEVWMAEGASLPALGVGDVVDLQGNVHLVGGRYSFWLSRARDAVVVGQQSPGVEADPGRPTTWEPWLGVPLRLEAVGVTGCPDPLDHLDTDRGLPVGGPWWAGQATRGDTLSAVTGVVAAVGAGHALWVRQGDPVEGGGSSDGCSLSIATARREAVTGAVSLPSAVVAVGPTEDGAAWVQDPGGGPDASLPVVGLKGVLAGQSVALRGRLALGSGRLALEVDDAVAGGAAEVVVRSFDPVVDDPAPWAGARVSIAGLTVAEAGPAGSLETVEGLRLDASLGALPWAAGASTGPVEGALDQWPDRRWVLVVDPAR